MFVPYFNAKFSSLPHKSEIPISAVTLQQIGKQTFNPPRANPNAQSICSPGKALHKQTANTMAVTFAIAFAPSTKNSDLQLTRESTDALCGHVIRRRALGKDIHFNANRLYPDIIGCLQCSESQSVRCCVPTRGPLIMWMQYCHSQRSCCVSSINISACKIARWQVLRII